MRKVIAILTAIACAPLLSSCANAPGGALTSSQLTAAQNAAGNIYGLVKAQAAAYTALPSVTASQASAINLAVQALGAATSQFQGISSLGSIEQDAQAVLSTASVVVSLIPTIDPTTKLAIEAAIATVQILLPVVIPVPAASTAIASGPL